MISVRPGPFPHGVPSRPQPRSRGGQLGGDRSPVLQRRMLAVTTASTARRRLSSPQPPSRRVLSEPQRPAPSRGSPEKPAGVPFRPWSGLSAPAPRAGPGLQLALVGRPVRRLPPEQGRRRPAPCPGRPRSGARAAARTPAYRMRGARWGDAGPAPRAGTLVSGRGWTGRCHRATARRPGRAVLRQGSEPAPPGASVRAIPPLPTARGAAIARRPRRRASSGATRASSGVGLGEAERTARRRTRRAQNRV